MRKRFRFGLRTLAVFLALVCIALWAVPAAMEWYKWRHVRAVVTDTMNEIAASPGKFVCYKGFVWHTPYYVLANVEIKWDPLTDSGTQMTSIPRSDAIFVEMPGKVHTWAQSPSEVMHLIRQND